MDVLSTLTPREEKVLKLRLASRTAVPARWKEVGQGVQRHP